jgi:LmbE family N-acetylglucosaminyl deacetylase
MNVTVISAHPDDEILGVGGTLVKHREAGDEITWIIVTNLYEGYGFSEERIKSRKKEIDKVSKALQVKRLFHFDYPTMKLKSDDLQTLIPKISGVFNDAKPEIIYCVNRSDAHSDHRITFDAIVACTKSFRYPFVKRVLMYECISETEFAPALFEKVFIPNYFVDISETMGEKLEIMKIYASELGEHPFPRSLRNISALATFRGASVGVEYAEAFQLIKYIDK